MVETSFGANRSWRCPEETTIAAYVQSRLARRDQDRFEVHLSGCDSCLSHVAFLVSAQESTEIEPVPEWLLKKAQALGTEDSPPPLLRWAVAGSLVLAMTGALWFLRTEGTETVRTLRGESDASLELLSPRERAVVPGGEVLFRWAPAENALFYVVNLVTAEGDLVWQSRFEETEARLPAEVRLVPNKRYYVWVRAPLSERGTLKSAAIAFEVSEEP
ncbi:MAG TPA: hypothetical protein VLK65_12255 [Vicinamibacteria bacterium]|nr:hypothetical protein [Vicinamibacteria bacterium]